MTKEAPTSCVNCSKAECGETNLKKKCDCCRDCRSALFRQPPKRDDCPICFLPLPALKSGQILSACCGKIICAGCDFEHKLQSKGHPTCPFCRADVPSSRKEYIKLLKKRVDSNDAKATYQLGNMYLNGNEYSSIKKDVDKAIKLFRRAAELGHATAFNNLAHMFYLGLYDVSKDDMKARQYYEKGAMAGCTDSRFNLGILDAEAGSFDRAIKHWLIGASCGEIRAVNHVKTLMAMGKATRDHYAQALRGYKQYVDEVRSDQRDRAAAYHDDFKYL